MSFKSFWGTVALAAGILVFGIWPSAGQSVADAYRKAAAAYREAADKTTEDKKGCYLDWAKHYDCLVAQMEGSDKKCEAPTCKPGE